MIKISIYSVSQNALCVTFANFGEFYIGSNNYFPNRTTETVDLVSTKFYIKHAREKNLQTYFVYADNFGK